jgi:hypothetical protein
MVYYNPSTATKNITVEEQGVNTELTIQSVNLVDENEEFQVYGYLKRADNNYPIGDETVYVRYNGTLLGADVTDGFGWYSLFGSIPNAGSYTLKAEFLGSQELNPAEATLPLDVLGQPATRKLALIALPMAVGYISVKSGQ